MPLFHSKKREHRVAAVNAEAGAMLTKSIFELAIHKAIADRESYYKKRRCYKPTSCPDMVVYCQSDCVRECCYRGKEA